MPDHLVDPESPASDCCQVLLNFALLAVQLEQRNCRQRGSPALMVLLVSGSFLAGGCWLLAPKVLGRLLPWGGCCSCATCHNNVLPCAVLLCAVLPCAVLLCAVLPCASEKQGKHGPWSILYCCRCICIMWVKCDALDGVKQSETRGVL
jgi:hypothetical protein